MNHASPADYDHCRAIMRHYATSYYFATQFFPADIRPSVYALYGFVRYPDQWVDCPDGWDANAIRAQLDAYERDLIRAVIGEPVPLPVLRAFADCVRRHRIPLRYCADFLDAMRMDLVRSRYQTFEDLQTYTWGSASVVGLMMAHILGRTDSETLHYAGLLGLAMQMTNFLRDVGEDYTRGRIYLPQAELQAYHLTEQDIAQGVVDERWQAFMRFQITRCRRLYQEAEQGVRLLPPSVQYPVLLGSRLYARILDAIERNGYDVFRLRARTSSAEKVRLAVETFWLCKKGILNRGDTHD